MSLLFLLRVREGEGVSEVLGGSPRVPFKLVKKTRVGLLGPHHP